MCDCGYLDALLPLQSPPHRRSTGAAINISMARAIDITFYVFYCRKNLKNFRY